MPYNPHLHNRNTIRLQGYNYAQHGAYFITICTHNKEPVFGEIKSGIMIPSHLGEIAYNQWLQLPQRFTNINLGAFVIMPNHIHGIIIIEEMDPSRRGEAGDNKHSIKPKITLSPASPTLPNEDSLPHGTIPGSISAIIQNYKSSTSRKINMLLRTKNKTTWQRNYYEHIIRDDNDYDRIVEYIENNPSCWSDDRYFVG
jgi:REP element-mobilizing transposase RayT